MGDKQQQVLASYKSDLARWEERGGKYRDITPLTVNEVILIKALLHPTKRRDSVEVTRQLVEFICEREVTTAEQIYQATGISDKPVLRRLKYFQQFGLVRREHKKYYLATPRMHELKKKFLRKVCEI